MKRWLYIAMTASLGIAAACSHASTRIGLAKLTSPDGEPLTQLTNDELRRLLRGAGVRAFGDDLHIDGFGCNWEWTHIGFRAPAYGRYSIRGNQYCLELQTGEHFGCGKVFRNEAGKVFGQGLPQYGLEAGPPTEFRITHEQVCAQ